MTPAFWAFGELAIRCVNSPNILSPFFWAKVSNLYSQTYPPLLLFHGVCMGLHMTQIEARWHILTPYSGDSEKVSQWQKPTHSDEPQDWGRWSLLPLGGGKHGTWPLSCLGKGEPRAAEVPQEARERSQQDTGLSQEMERNTVLLAPSEPRM